MLRSLECPGRGARTRYALRPIPFPVVPRGEDRIRVIVHARNTEAELDELVGRLVEWAWDFLARETARGGILRGQRAGPGVSARL